MAGSMEIRLHGRGGQGGVTCAKILAAVFSHLGKSVQAFGDYAGERSGAPVRAFTRVSDQAIVNRNKVYQPDHMVVLDRTLLSDTLVAGLAPGGVLVINSPDDPAALAKQFAPYRVATVDATRIARSHKIGSRSVVIVNTTIAGAVAKLLDLPFDALEKTYEHLGLMSNLAAAKEAWDAVKVAGPLAKGTTGPRLGEVSENLPEVLPLEVHVQSPVPTITTGSWRSQTPRYQEHLAPCSAFCPAGNDVVGFVQALATQGEEAAAAVLGATTPFSAVCGRVCPAPCMEGCNRREVDGSVDIRGLERWIAQKKPVAKKGQPHPDPKRFAVVGGGPAGLSAAYQLGLLGHQVSVFEGERALGGVLRTGIPTYRLPRQDLDVEIDGVLALGVKVHCGELVSGSRLMALAKEFDAVIVATGLQKLRAADGPGAELSGVEQGIHFLRRLNMEGKAPLAGHVVVLGGGNTAMDCARSALRCGASRVTVAYRRSREEMPAIPEEIEHAHEEGVEYAFLRAPAGFAGTGGKVSAVKLAHVELGPPDASGRRSPKVTDRVDTLPCDVVLLALGQSADLSLLPKGWELKDGRAFADGKALNVFAAGDVATGEGTVTHAIGSGRRAAGLALSALGQAVQVFARPDRQQSVPVTDIRLDHFERAAPAAHGLLSAKTRARDFSEVDQGLPGAMESHRCFSCGHCTKCDTCLVYCPEGIIHRKEGGYEIDYSYCKGCGICVTECPRKSMEMSAS